MLLTVNAAALRPSLNKSFQPPLIYLSRLLAKDDYAAARVKGGRYIYIYIYMACEDQRGDDQPDP